MAASKTDGLLPKAKGNIYLKIGIVVMTLLLAWSINSGIEKKEENTNKVRLTRAKMKTLMYIEGRYLFADTSYTEDIAKLKVFAVGADTVLPDSLFQPVIAAYQRFETHAPLLENMSAATFRKEWIDSVFINPLTAKPFIFEIINAQGRKTFSIKPSTDENVIKNVGAVIEGELTWDEKKNESL